MKIRTGFVSNSSTSSFCVLGISLTPRILEGIEKNYNKEEKEKLPERIRGCSHKLPNTKIKFCPECGQPAWIPNPELEDDDFDMYAVIEELGFEYYTESEEGEVMGISPGDLDENLSIKEHKKVLAEKISKISGVIISAKDVKFLSGEYAS